MTTTTDKRNVRLLNVDALRGFALLGILAVNIWAFADPYYASTSTNPTYDSALDHGVRFLVELLFETKFYLLFSFLFGYSFTLQMAAAERAETAFIPRMVRRQGGLLAIGLAHGALLYYGEILSTYAILGLVLIACRNLRPQRAVKIAAWIVITAATLWTLLGIAQLAVGEFTGSTSSETATKLSAFSGSAADALAFHSHHLGETIAVIAIIQAPSAMAMFFLGFAAGRKKVFADPQRYASQLRHIIRIGLPVGLGGSAFYASAATFAPGGGIETVAFGIGQITAPFLTASYVALGLTLFTTASGAKIERVLAPMGKIALTNYLLQSAVLGVLFTGYGLGLVDQLSPIVVLAIVPIVFCAQIGLSTWWLKRHVYGPAEWVLRAVTNAEIPAWRRRPE
ncbi:DUF418 domain-containing protein [Aeromicrobium sp. P5_D10]